MTTLTPEELRQAADVVEQWNAAADYGDPPDLVAQSPRGLRRFADHLEAEAEKTARRERLVEELAQTMHQTDVAVGHRLRTWAKTTEPIRDDFRRFARAVLDRFPSLLEADDE